jgi:hypothetical protein
MKLGAQRPSTRATPPADETIRAGDELGLAGTADAFLRAALLFRVGVLDPGGWCYPDQLML